MKCKKTLIALTSTIVPTILTVSILTSSRNNLLMDKNDDSIPPLQSNDIATIPITNHITNNLNVGSFWSSPTETDVISRINSLKGQTGVSNDLKINQIFVQTLPTPSGTTNVTAVIGVQPWSEYYDVNSTTNVIYNVNPQTFKTNISTIITGNSTNDVTLDLWDSNVTQKQKEIAILKSFQQTFPTLNINQVKIDAIGDYVSQDFINTLYTIQLGDRSTIYKNISVTISPINDSTNYYGGPITKTFPIPISSQDFNYTGSAQEFIAPASQTFLMESWGAAGGFISTTRTYGFGGYTEGFIPLDKETKIFTYVGQIGVVTTKSFDITRNSWNGGGSAMSAEKQFRKNSSGGGATDFRLLKSTSAEDGWSDALSLNSRIMVAGGAGGSVSYREDDEGEDPNYSMDAPLYGGGLIGGKGGAGGRGDQDTTSTGGTQTSPGGNSVNFDASLPEFGIGAINDGHVGSKYNAGGGGGYYGGGGGTNGSSVVYTGAGGSSFISGMDGCVAIADPLNDTNPTRAAKTTDDITALTYLGNDWKFTNANTIDGATNMHIWNTIVEPTSTMTGNNNNGHARIYWIGK